MLCMISPCLVPTESRGSPKGHLEQRPPCPDGAEGTQPRVCISLHTSPAPGSSQQQRLWGQVKTRALLSPARIQFLGPIPKAAALFAQENTAEQRHSQSQTHSALTPPQSPHPSMAGSSSRREIGAHTAAKHPLPPKAVLAQGLGEGKHRSVFFTPLMFCFGSRNTSSRQMHRRC